MKHLSPICLFLCVQISFGQTKLLKTFEHIDVSFASTEQTKEQVIVIQSKNDLHFYDISSGRLSKALQFDAYAPFEDGYSVVRKDQQLFYLDRFGNSAFKGKFDEVSALYYGLTAVKRKGKAYIINMQGKQVFKGKYERIHSFTDKVALVEKDGAVFLIDTKGKRLNTYSIVKARLHESGCYVFQTEKGLSLINREGKMIGTSNYTKVEFIDPIIYFEKATSKGFLNHEGEEFLYFDGYTRPNNRPLKSPFFYIYKNKIGALADTTGKLLTDFEYNYLRQATANRVIVTKHLPMGSKKGLINLQGEVVVPIQWDNINKARDSELFTVRNKNGDIQYENLVSENGEYFLPVENQNYKKLEYCSEDLAVVRMADTLLNGHNRSRYLLVNRKGEILTEEPYHVIGKFVDGVAAAHRYIRDGEQLRTTGGYLKSTGEFKAVNAINCQKFHDGYSVFFTHNTPRKYGLIDQNLKLIVPIDSGYESILNFFSEDLFVVRRGKLWGYIDQHGKEVIPPQYVSAEPFVNGLGRVNHNIYLNRKGDTIVNGPEGSILRSFVNGFAAVSINGLWGYFNTRGRMVIPPSYRNAGDFADGYATVGMGTLFANEPQGVIDTLGRKALELQYNQITSMGNMSNGDPLWQVRLEDNTYALVTLGDKRILEESYQQLEVLHDAQEEPGRRTLIIGVRGKYNSQLLKVEL